MKNNRQAASRQMDEREKLRKFRELDDAFATALQELDGGGASNEDAAPQEPPFEERLQALMQEYNQSSQSVATLMRTIVEIGHASREAQ
ncbi:hypothetical protein ACFO0E_06400 [Chromohalobacter beijerinckii]|uniref:Uncharacterized protein n=1 Tax=Chromohalobacter beijerinckii TaxID=86179 RepID=A0ABV8XB07_9GAMM|nr:hypothetical protein [Chromohalobacter beijerinckii]MCK0767000.1 hypothetical protein [Chromohalobacter beijerinckii]